MYDRVENETGSGKRQGHALTEDELNDLLFKSARRKAEQAYKETKDMYEDGRTKEEFDRWKSSKFSQYDQVKHDEFLKDRYKTTE